MEIFVNLGGILQACGHPRVDGILFDLGVSSHQLDTPSRGFSFRQDGPLDMRMDTRQEATASTLVNQASSEQLRVIFRTLGQERWARRIARAIVEVRDDSAITRTRHLADLVAQTIPRAAWPPRIHPATRVFQALRMAVNHELPAPGRCLAASRGGAAVVAAASVSSPFILWKTDRSRHFFASRHGSASARRVFPNAAVVNDRS